MQGYYLYCIKERGDCKFSAKGLEGEEVFVISYQDLEVVVSKISLEKFGQNEIQKKAREDLNWIKEKAQIHEIVIEGFMKDKHGIKNVIPMKFGTIFKTKEKLEETLKKHYSEFKKTLENLRGKQEWAVKIYLNRKIFKEEIRGLSLMIREKEKEMASLSEGMAYFAQKQLDDIIAKEANSALENYTDSIFRRLKIYAFAGTKGKILAKELTGKPLPMVLNVAFLIPEKKLEDFKKEINRLGREHKHKGFNFECSGPWPPYHFVT